MQTFYDNNKKRADIFKTNFAKSFELHFWEVWFTKYSLFQGFIYNSQHE